METGEPIRPGAVLLEDIRSLFRSYARLVREHFGDRVNNIWLYGSAARGDWTEESDIDVLVVFDREDEGDVEWLVRTAYRVGLQENRRLIQPILLSKAEFERLVAQERRFALDILREGMAA